VNYTNFRTYRRTGESCLHRAVREQNNKKKNTWNKVGFPFGFRLRSNSALICIHFESECTAVLTNRRNEILKQSVDFRMKIVPYIFNWRPINFHP